MHSSSLLRVIIGLSVVAVKRLPVLHHGAEYIFISFGIIEPILVTLKILLKPVLGGVSSLANYIVAYEEP